MESIMTQYGSPFVAAILIGLGCGFSCGSTSTVFLTTYIMGNKSDAKQGFFSVLHFTAGKIIAVAILGIISSYMGTAIVGQTADSGLDLKFLINVVEVLTGLMIFYKMFKKKSCCARGNCGKTAVRLEKKSNITGNMPLWFAGAAYGVTPCYPLGVMLLFSAAMPPLNACLLMVLFGIATSISPVVVYGTMAGYFANKMHGEIPQYMNFIQGMAAAVFIFIGIYPIVA